MNEESGPRAALQVIDSARNRHELTSTPVVPVPRSDRVRLARAALAATDAPPGPVASSEQGPLRLSAYPDLWVIDFDRAPQWLRRALIDAWQMSYAVGDVILDGETLRHLGHLADERAARNQQKLSRLLTHDNGERPTPGESS
jgi:hypothetical protein